MPQVQLKAGASLCSKLMQDYSLTGKDIKRHKDLTATVCPGKNFRFLELKKMLATVQNPILDFNGVIYTVQVGAFKTKSNAEKLRQQLVNEGYKDILIKQKYV